MLSRFAQPIEARVWVQCLIHLPLVPGDAGRSVHIRPIRESKARRFLELETGRWIRPGDCDVWPAAQDAERRRGFRLNHARGAPESALQGVGTAAGGGGIGLTDGALKRVRAGGTLAAATIEGEPVDGVLSGGVQDREEQEDERENSFHRV